MSTSSASMRRAEIGSSPENGSSQSRIAGSRMMRARQRDALQHAARELAREQVVDVRAGRPRRAARARAAISARPRRSCSRSGSARLSNTVIESSSAPPWNIMPSLRRTPVRCALAQSRVTSSPSTTMRPLRAGRARRSGAGGCSCPSRCRRGSPRSCRGESRRTASKTTRGPKAMCTPRNCTWNSWLSWAADMVEVGTGRRRAPP